MEPNTKDIDKGKYIRILKMIGNIVFATFSVLIGIIVLFSIFSKLKGDIPSIAGYQLYNVLGSSMEPSLHKGSIVLIKRINPEDLAVNDIITFRGNGDSNKLVTHRIVSINRTDSLSFETRGDANDANDISPVLASQILGKAGISIPVVGYLVHFTQSKVGLLTMIIIPGVLIIIFELRNLIKYMIQFKQAKVQTENN